MLQYEYMICHLVYSLDPRTAKIPRDQGPTVKGGGAASEASLPLIVGGSHGSVQRAGQAVLEKLMSMYNPHTLIGG